MKHKQPMFKLALLAVMTTAIAVFFTGCGEDDEKQIKVPTVTTTAASAITTTSATLGGKVTSDGGADIISSGVVYSTEDVDLNIENHDIEEATLGSDGSFSVELEGLTSGETYYFQAYAVNKKGIAYGTRLNVELGNAAPVAMNVTITMSTEEIEIGTVLTAGYDYEDAEDDLQGASAYQWYKATDDLGTGEEAIAGATASTYTVLAADEFTYIRVGITPVATAGTLSGSEAKSDFTDEVPEAPETVTFTYNGQSVTYGVIQSTVTNRKWMDRNLGAIQVADTYDDYKAYGDLFQWGRLDDGHQLTTWTDASSATSVNGTTTTTSPTDIPPDALFIIDPTITQRDWRTTINNSLWNLPDQTNNPCPTGWHIPTVTEWNAENLEGKGWTEAFGQLMLTKGGNRDYVAGVISIGTNSGLYWSSTVKPDDTSNRTNKRIFVLNVSDNTTSLSYWNKGEGLFCRCIKNLE